MHCVRSSRTQAPTSPKATTSMHAGEAFWGQNYPRLLAAKRAYDADGLFFVHDGVGSDDWSADGFDANGWQRPISPVHRGGVESGRDPDPGRSWPRPTFVIAKPDRVSRNAAWISRPWRKASARAASSARRAMRWSNAPRRFDGWVVGASSHGQVAGQLALARVWIGVEC